MPSRLLDQKALWQQMDGPQANALINAGRSWMKSWLNPLLDYFRGWNLDTAKGRHLDLIGLFLGVARPVTVADFFFDNAFKFSDAPPEGPIVVTGFSEAPSTQRDIIDFTPVTAGGLFDYAAPEDRPALAFTDMADVDYRVLLKGIRDGEGEVGSLLFVDYVCNLYTQGDYTIGTANGIIGGTRQEDILITILNPDVHYRAYQVLTSIMEAFVNPFPQVYIMY